MNNVSKILALVGAGVLLPLALSAKSAGQTYVDSFQGASPEVPVPTAVAMPQTTARAGGQVELTFVVNTAGVPTNIAVVSASDTALAEPAKEAVAKWKFTPAKVNGEAVPKKVMLPMRFIAMD